MQAEVEAFVKAAEEFQLSNPRELWRMRQSWSMLKGLGVADLTEDADVQVWLRHLFFREKSLQATSIMREAIENAFNNKAQPGVAVEVMFSKAIGDLRSGFAARDRIIRTVLLPATR